MDTVPFRFGGIARLVSEAGYEHLRAAHVAVIGIGGVGSWVAEGLARSGVGRLTLVDLDDVCESNINRQIHALQSTIGQPKVEAMAARIKEISPATEVSLQHGFYTAARAEQFWVHSYDFVVDAIDSVENKCHCLAEAHRRKVPILAMGGAGGKIDPTQIAISDLSRTEGDPLLRRVRKVLRNQYSFPKGDKKKFHIPAVYSPELPKYPWSDGTVCEQKEDSSPLYLDCSSGFGTASFVTGTFGLIAAGYVVQQLVADTGALTHKK